MTSPIDRDTKEQHRERFEERAAIMEHDGKQMRSRAEIAARIEADTWLDARLAAMQGREVSHG